jgi:hypothetical protein
LYNKIFPGFQPCQLVKRRKNQRFKDHLSPRLQSTDHITFQKKGKRWWRHRYYTKLLKHPLSLSCQRGNNAVTCYCIKCKVRSTVTARPIYKQIRHVRPETHDFQQIFPFYMFCILPNNRVLLSRGHYGTLRTAFIQI